MPIDIEKLVLEAKEHRARFQALIDIIDSTTDPDDLTLSERAKLLRELNELPAQMISNWRLAQQHFADKPDIKDRLDKQILELERIQAFVAGQETSQ